MNNQEKTEYIQKLLAGEIQASGLEADILQSVITHRQSLEELLKELDSAKSKVQELNDKLKEGTGTLNGLLGVLVNAEEKRRENKSTLVTNT